MVKDSGSSSQNLVCRFSSNLRFFGDCAFTPKSSSALQKHTACTSKQDIVTVLKFYNTKWDNFDSEIHEKYLIQTGEKLWNYSLGPVVQSVVSLTMSLRVISLTVLADPIHNILIFFAEKMWVAFALQKLFTFFQQKISEYLHITRCKF